MKEEKIMNDISNGSIQELMEKISTNVSKYVGIKNNFLDDEYIEAFSDSFALAKVMTNGYKLVSKKKLAYFLRGLNLESEPTAEQLNKLSDYIDSEEKAEFITENITKVLVSKSKNATFLLGVIVNRHINSKNELTYIELICANALSEFYDFDLENISVIKKYTDFLRVNNSRYKGWFDLFNKFKKWCADNDISISESYKLTIEKCISTQILIKDFEVYLSIDEDNPDTSSASSAPILKFTEAGELLLNNLKYLEIIKSSTAHNNSFPTLSGTI